MSNPTNAEVLAVMRETLWKRLGLELDEFYSEDELVARWIAHGIERGDSPQAIAVAFASWMHEKHELEWVDRWPQAPMAAMPISRK